MKEWIKFYFGGFFSNKRLAEASSRSFWNTVLSLFLTFVIVWGGLSVGYIASFGRHYAEAKDFQCFLSESLGKDNAYGVYLTVTDGKLRAEFDGEADCINTFDSTEATYRLVVDTRPKETTFDAFLILCKDENGNEISYDEYVALDTPQKERYDCSVVYSGQSLDVVANLADYEAHLQEVSDASSSKYDKDIADKYNELKRNGTDDDADLHDYAIGVYELYFAAKYPIFIGKDAYGKAPTLRTYYMELEKKAPNKKYVLLFDDIAMCAFDASGVDVDFAGYLSKVSEGTVTSREMTAEQVTEKLNGFFGELFASGSALASFVFSFSLMQTIPIFLLAVLLLTFLVYVVCKVKHSEDCTGFIGALKVVGATLFVSAAATALNALILSFVMSRGTVFRIVTILLLMIVTIRSIVFVIGAARNSKATGTDPAEASLDDPER